MSERVEIAVPTPGGTEQKANVLLEGGPRTLRPNGSAVLELVSHLPPRRFLSVEFCGALHVQAAHGTRTRSRVWTASA